MKSSKSPKQRRDQKARIQALYDQLQLPRLRHRPGEVRDLDAEEKLLRYLVTIEEGPTTTYARQLIADGIELPPPDSFTEDSVSDKLWEVIRGLAHRRTFLSSTDHLSDLDLYRHLWKQVLNMKADELDPANTSCACFIDLLDDGSQESAYFQCRYYADEWDRSMWEDYFPDGSMPEKIDPPFQRDRHLPKAFSTC